MVLCSRLGRAFLSLLLLFGHSLVQGPRGPALVPPAHAEYHDIFGEPDVNTRRLRNSKMRGSKLGKTVASTVDRIVTAREGLGALDTAIEANVGTIGRFGEKDATSYLEAYRAEMVMRDIPEDMRLAGFPRVAMPGIHAEVLEARAESRTWEEFEGRLLEKYGLDDVLRLSNWDFMEWVATPEKGRNALVLL